MGRGKLLSNRRKKCENNGRPLRVSFIYWCRLTLKAMNSVVLSMGICWYWFAQYVPQTDALLLAIVRSMLSEFDQYVSQVLSFVSLFCLGKKKKKTLNARKIHVESRAEPALGSGLDKGMQFHLYHWQKHYGHSQHYFLFFLFLFRLHIQKREKKINQLTIDLLRLPQSYEGTNHETIPGVLLEKEATWIMWLHFLLLPFFQSFIIGKRFYFHHTLIVFWCTEAKW